MADCDSLTVLVFNTKDSIALTSKFILAVASYVRKCASCYQAGLTFCYSPSLLLDIASFIRVDANYPPHGFAAETLRMARALLVSSLQAGLHGEGVAVQGRHSKSAPGSKQ